MGSMTEIDDLEQRSHTLQPCAVRKGATSMFTARSADMYGVIVFVHLLAGLGLLSLDIGLSAQLEPCHKLGELRQPQNVYIVLPDGTKVDQLVEATPRDCETRCKNSPGCGYFNFWPSGVCRLAPVTAVVHRIEGVISGPVMCREEQLTTNSSKNYYNAHQLWMVDGMYYDLRPLMSWHPGSKLPLLKTMGSDATALFRVQHLSERPRNALHKYAVPSEMVIGEIEPELFNYSFDADGFYMTVRARVNKLLADLGVTKPRQASYFLLGKIGINLLLFTGTWYHIVVKPFSAAACITNMLSRAVLTGMAHEAMHGNVLPQFPATERMFASFCIEGFLCFPLGDWYEEHVIFHHPHTKTSIDPDDNIKQAIPCWRLTHVTPWTQMHSYPITSHTILGLLLPTLRFFAGKSSKLFSPYAAVRSEGVSAAAWLVLLHWLPLFVQRNKKKALLAILLSSMSASAMTLFFFHANHLFAQAETIPHYQGVDWGSHQLHTTANFVAKSFSGGLDLQIEHHLFPMLSYQHQQAVQPIVQQTAKEFGLPYHSFSNIGNALHAHFSHMIELGREPSANVSGAVVVELGREF